MGPGQTQEDCMTSWVIDYKSSLPLGFNLKWFKSPLPLLSSDADGWE